MLSSVTLYCQVTTIVSSSNWRYKYCLARKSLVVNWGLWQQQHFCSTAQSLQATAREKCKGKNNNPGAPVWSEVRWRLGMALSLHGMIVCGRWELLLLKKKSINANRKERKCLTRFLANFLDKEWNFKERSWGSFTCGQLVSGQVPREWSGQEHAGRCLGERGFSNPNTKIQTQHKHVRKTNLCEKK